MPSSSCPASEYLATGTSYDHEISLSSGQCAHGRLGSVCLPSGLTVYAAEYCRVCVGVVPHDHRDRQQEVPLAEHRYPGGYLHEVPQERTGTFSGDINGYWQTQDGFQFNSSLFQLKFSGHGLNNKQYREAMQWFEMKLHQFGGTAVKRNSLWSLNTWASFTLEHPATKLQLSSNVDAGFVYDGAIIAPQHRLCFG